MPVSNITPIISYVANGETSQFNFPFRVMLKSDLLVYINNVLQLNNYTVSGVDNPDGGVVTFNTPPFSGRTVRLKRSVPRTRESDYVEGGELGAQTLDDDFDRVVMQIQDFNEDVVSLDDDGNLDMKGARLKNVAYPLSAGDAINLQYIANVALDGIDPVATAISFVPTETVESINVQEAIEEVDVNLRTLFSTGTVNAVNINGVISSGSLVLNPDGYVRAGQTAYNTGTGFYLGNDGGVPKLSIGIANGKGLRWNGSSLVFDGDLMIEGLPTSPNTIAANITTANNAANTAMIEAVNATTQLSNFSNDNVLSPGEKPPIKLQFDQITQEQTGIDTQADLFQVTTEKTTYDTAVTALTSYMATLTTPVLWSNFTGNTSIVGSTFRTKFGDVYSARQAVLNAILEKTNEMADAAQTQANTAVSNAATAQTTANTAVSNAATAQTTANTAATNALTAINSISDISSDSLLTPDEKPSIKLDYDSIIAEQSGIDTQATSFGITTEKTTYDVAVTALTSHLATLTTPVLWSNFSGNTTIVGTTFRTKFGDVYSARQALLNKISTVAATKADYANVSGAKPPVDANNTTSALNAGVPITGGGITLSSGGAIASYGKTWSNTVEGFYLGYTGTYGKYGLDIVGTGQFRIRSATTGARLEILDNVIKVYDAEGVLRVKIGDLS